MNTNMNMITVVFLSAFISIIACLTLDVDDLYTETPEAPVKVDLEKAVTQLFTQLARQSQTSQTKKVDFVFIIDTGISMHDHIKKLLPALGDLGYICAQSNLDCRFGLVKFWELAGNPQIEIYSTLTSADLIQKNLASFAAMPKEFRRKSGCGLDAIFKAMVEIPYRTDSLRHLILITDQPLRSSQPGSEEKLVSEIISKCSSAQSAQTQVSIIGVSESFSAMLAGRTKGGWQPIFPYTGAKPKPSVSEVLGKQLLKIDGSIKEVAKHIAETCKPSVDVIFMIDSSDSMANKVDEIIEALPIFTETFDKSKLNYQFGAIRFYAATGGGEGHVIVSQPPLSLDGIKKLLQLPKSGDEHLIDAILEGIPKLKTRPEAKVTLVILTDEPSTTVQKANIGDLTSQAVALCKTRNIQVNVIGAAAYRQTGDVSFSKLDFASDFQMQAPGATGGVRFMMPRGDEAPSEIR